MSCIIDSTDLNTSRPTACPINHGFPGYVETMNAIFFLELLIFFNLIQPLTFFTIASILSLLAICLIGKNSNLLFFFNFSLNEATPAKSLPSISGRATCIIISVGDSPLFSLIHDFFLFVESET